jgi:hypothetical protein
MESSRRISAPGRRADGHTDRYAFVDTYTLPDNNPYQHCHVDAYAHTHEDANFHEDSPCHRYAIVWRSLRKSIG